MSADPALAILGRLDDMATTAQGESARCQDLKDIQDVVQEISSNSDDGSKRGPSQATQIVTMVHERADLVHDNNRDAFAILRESGEVLSIDGRAFKDIVSSGFYYGTRTAISDKALKEAVSTLGGMARHEGQRVSINVRVAGSAGAYFVDLGEQHRSRVIRVDRGGWVVLDRCDHLFVRHNGMEPLPAPRAGGSLQALFEMANIPEDSRLLVTTVLVDSLRPDTPYPLVEIVGEQGSGKSVTQRMMRRLIDPNACDLRAPPRSPEDVFVCAGRSHVLSIENASFLSDAVQDALCTVSTGGGQAVRKLYTDSEEVIRHAKNPVFINGIANTVTRQDLLDRTISIEIPRLRSRIEVTALWAEFEKEHPRILGALLNIASRALAILPEIELPENDQPRLIEFAKLGCAVARAMGRPSSEFLEAYRERREEAVTRVLDASPVAGAIVEWFNGRDRRTASQTIKDLMEAIGRPAHVGDTWPRSAKGFADALRRAAPGLRTLGIDVEPEGRRGGACWWRISERKSPERSPASPPSPGEPHSFGQRAGHEGLAGHDLRDFPLDPEPERVL